MKRICLAGLLMAISTLALSAGDSMTLSATELERLGVEFGSASPAGLTEVGSGPAQVVIPPTQQFVVGTTVSGVLSRLLVAEGETVVAGQVLAEIESPGLLALQRAFIDAFAAKELAQLQLQRDRGLQEEGIIADRRLRETVAAASAASVALDQSKQQLRLAGLSSEQLRMLSDRRQLSSTLELHSPIDGVVVSQLSSLGNQIDALAPVFRVADLSQLWLEVRVSQQQAQSISLGMQVIAPDYDERLSAEVCHIGPTLDPVSQTVMIRAFTDNELQLLRPGQFLSTRIVTAASDAGNTYVVPSKAIVNEGANTFLFVRTEDGVAARQVRLLSDNGRQTFIATGEKLKGGIVVSGVAALKSIWLEAGADE